MATLKSLTLGLFHVFQSGHSYMETEENGSQAKMILVHFPENKVSTEPTGTKGTLPETKMDIHEASTKLEDLFVLRYGI